MQRSIILKNPHTTTTFKKNTELQTLKTFEKFSHFKQNNTIKATNKKLNTMDFLSGNSRTVESSLNEKKGPSICRPLTSNFSLKVTFPVKLANVQENNWVERSLCPQLCTLRLFVNFPSWIPAPPTGKSGAQMGKVLTYKEIREKSLH